MLPVVTIDEMRAIDDAATAPVGALIERAGAAVARTALDMLGGGYGRRVVVLAGRGNNGADGRVASRRLEGRGVRTIVLDIADLPARLPPADLVIDAALGTGISRPFHAPSAGDTPVLAVDIPSGIDGDTGVAVGTPLAAEVTVTFAAHKPGLVLGAGPVYAGEVLVADIGLDTSRARIELVTDAGAGSLLPARSRDAHKWSRSVLVVAGSPGMTGAAALCAAAALRTGAGMVRLASPGLESVPGAPREVVTVPVDETGWTETLLEGQRRVHAVAIGPGLGTSMVARHQTRALIAGLDVPIVVDGDALTAIAHDAADILSARTSAAVLTPHDGEFERLTGHRPGDDRIADVRSLAADVGAVVLAKGPTTVVAAPDGRVRLVTAGDERLATAGTGDVLSGIVAALLAGGLDAFDAASVGAHLHGVAGRTGPRMGTVASDVVDAIPAALAGVAARTAS